MKVHQIIAEHRQYTLIEDDEHSFYWELEITRNGDKAPFKSAEYYNSQFAARRALRDDCINWQVN